MPPVGRWEVCPVGSPGGKESLQGKRPRKTKGKKYICHLEDPPVPVSGLGSDTRERGRWRVAVQGLTILERLAQPEGGPW